jgi:hypothetical protein
MKIHIPTEQYGFIEADVETVEEAKNISDEIKSTFKDNYDGLDTKVWNKCLDHYLTEYTMSADDYANMNKAQIACIQEIKKSMARISNKL